MSWTNELYAVYDKAIELKTENAVLLPVSHSAQKAQLEITIDGSGNFLNAKKVEDENDAVTIIPVTEDSGARSSGICPHPFADKLVYIAGDYCERCNSKKGDEDKFGAYILQLREWRNSELTHPSVNALYDYLSKGTLIKDLIGAGVLTADENGKLTADKIQKIAQSDCFVRFRVNGNSEEQRTWLDKTLYDKFIAYNASLQGEKALCYATGKQVFCTYKHPKYILRPGDGGKLFSTNDETGYSYRGRFLNKEQTVSIGYEFSQKMHNALKWLIARQGVPIGSLVLLAWDSALSDLPEICGDSASIISESEDAFDDMDTGFDPLPATFPSYKNTLEQAVFGSKAKTDLNEKVMIMVLDEATVGRISVNMYSELYKSDFYNNVKKWHTDTAWNRYNFVEKKDYIGSFALPQIVEFAYGTEQNGKIVCKPEVKSDIMARLIPCVIDGRKLPTDILRQLINRTSRRSAYSNSWNMLLAITCGMIRKSMIEKGEDYGMALDKDCNSRSYLFGRLLAVAEAAENSTYEKGQERTTNAERYFEKFSNSPAATWTSISQRLSPYFNGMNKGMKTYYQKIIDEIMDKFERGDFNNEKLKPEFLLAYSCQRKELYTKKQNDNSNDDSKEV